MFLPLITAGCVLSVRPLADDFSDLSPPDALSASLDRLEGAYSFTAWKALDWATIRDDLTAQMDAAETDAEVDAVFRHLLLTLPDGHAALWNDDPARDPCPEADGALGVDLAETDDGSVIVVAAEEATGLLPGDVLTGWDGLSPEDAIDAAPLRCVPIGLATHERRRILRVRLLGRAPLGTDVAITVTRSGTDHDVTLTATDDGDDVRAHLGLTPAAERLTAQMLSADVGHIHIGWEDTVLSETAFRAALADLWDRGARRLVLDLRDNDGGTDQTAANIVGVFADREHFYETITMYDRRTGDQAAISEVFVAPQELYWDLPVVVLINGNTVSSGEGMAMMLDRLGIPTVGFEGTAASFGSAGSTIALPGGFTLSYPAGRSLDIDGVIQLDSDHTLTGGVQPSHRVPWTTENLTAHAADPDGFLIDHAVEHVLGGW